MQMTLTLLLICDSKSCGEGSACQHNIRGFPPQHVYFGWQATMMLEQGYYSTVKLPTVRNTVQ